MNTTILINVRLGTTFRLIAVILFLSTVMSKPGYAHDVFGYKLDAGTGSTKSILKNQGYTVHFSRSLNHPHLSYIEFYGFKNEYLNDMHLWIDAYKYRVYSYRWEGKIMANQSGAASMERLLQYLSKTFGEPEIPASMKTTYKKIDASLLKALAAGEGNEDRHFFWKKNEEQIEMYLSTPLLPMPDKLEFTLLYFAPEFVKEVSIYKHGD